MATIIGNTTTTPNLYINEFEQLNTKLDEISAKLEGAEVQPTLQDKTATENGTVTPDEGYDGLSSVTVNVVTPAYDGTVEAIRLISFTLADDDGKINGTFRAEEGMTWAIWIESTYNTVRIYSEYDYASGEDLVFYPNGVPLSDDEGCTLYPNDAIKDGCDYSYYV